jgi:hypothetical protein
VVDRPCCEFRVVGRRVRRMLLVAAESGGIRAAYWIVRGMEAMGEKTCAGRSALFSAGASGGSVGLTVARFSGTATDPGITRAVEREPVMGDSRAVTSVNA